MVDRFKRLEDAVIPQWVDYSAVNGLSTEVRERLAQRAAAVARAGGADARDDAGGDFAPRLPSEEPPRPRLGRDPRAMN